MLGVAGVFGDSSPASFSCFVVLVIEMNMFVTQVLLLAAYLAVPSQSQTTEGGQFCVVINEIVHKPVPGEEDWIELFNQCDELVDLQGYYLRDGNPESLTKLGDDSLGCVAQIPPRGYLLLVKNQPCSFSFGLGSDDEVILLDPDLKELQVVVWTKNDAREGKSWARLPSGTGPFQTTLPTPGEFNGISLIVPEKVATDPADVTVIINELVNKPIAPELDWIELYNYGEEAVDLTGLRLTDEATNPGDGFYFGQEGCTADTIIQPGEYKVLEKDQPCSFDFGLGDSDQAALWFDQETVMDSTRVLPPPVTKRFRLES
eukprot:TRINITY_DN14163_c0_g2_i4.p1 TRINITY_DN14163_c0_g2~~TRINITY_DN14163_c0_g2_i4.p1  ORF type:complete len:317 (+),score=62.09 TRINITY_DN14163_c0_g2_i4:3-953(+)